MFLEKIAAHNHTNNPVIGEFKKKKNKVENQLHIL